MASKEKFLIIPPPHHLAVEISYYQKKLEFADASKTKKSQDEAALHYAEIARRKDLYSAGAGVGYEPPSEVSKKERAALLNFFREFNGCNWNRNFGWIGLPKTSNRAQVKKLEVESGLFEGIVVGKSPSWARSPGGNSGNAVCGISMNGNNCEGDFPSCIQEFTMCQALKLEWNLISGHIPRNFSRLVNLQSIQLSSNFIEGHMSKDVFGAFERLQSLDLSFNQLSGHVPNCFSNYTSLVTLNLAGNEFTGAIPVSLQNVSSLKELKLQNNQLSGSINDINVFPCLVNLVDVNLSKNRLTGTIDCFMQCVAIEKLILNHNQLSGCIPKTISNLIHLEMFYIHNNRISGPIPEELCMLHETLSLFNCSNNCIESVIPDNIGNCTKLLTLILHGNDIIGPTPPSMRSLVNLHDFSCFSNCNTESFQIPRAFSLQTFERIYVKSLDLKLDTVHWDPVVLYGDESVEEMNRRLEEEKMKKPLVAGGIVRNRYRKNPMDEVKPVHSNISYSKEKHNPRYRLSSQSAARNIKFSLDDY